MPTFSFVFLLYQKKTRGNTAAGPFFNTRRSGLLRDHADHLDDLVRVAPLVVVPRADLDERRVELDARLDVEDRGLGLVAEVARDDRLVRVAQNALEAALGDGRLGRLLHRRADFRVGRRLLELGREVDERDVGGRNADGHARELAVERRENLADGLRRARRGRDHVLEDATTTAPILLGRAIDSLLRRRRGVNRRHEAALDAEVVVEDLRDRREAVRRARRVGDHLLAGVLLVVDAVDEHRGGVARGSGHDDLLRAGVEVHLRLLGREEETRGLDDDVDAEVAPRDEGLLVLVVVRGLLGEDLDDLAVDVELLLLVRTGDLVLEPAVHGIVLQHVREVLGVEEVVDADDLDVAEIVNRSAENHAADAAETVDANLDSHF